jgi:hypothetical protein
VEPLSRQAALLLAAVAAAGCTGFPARRAPVGSPATAGSPAPASSAAVTAPQVALHADPVSGFALAVPDAWDAVVRGAPGFATEIEVVGRHSPELKAYFQKSLAGDPELRLIAADSRSLAGGFATNANVSASDLGAPARAPGLQDLAAAKLRRLQAESAVVMPLSRHDDRLGGRAAMRFDYSLKVGDAVVNVRTYLVIVERTGRRQLLALTMGASPDQAAATFAGIAGSFRVTAQQSAPGGSTPGA